MIEEQDRFSKLQFPVHKITAKTPDELFKSLPGLRRYFQNVTVSKPETVDISSPNGKPEKITVNHRPSSYRGIHPDDLVKIIKYIVFVYDPDSDLMNEYGDEFRLLKEAAAKEAGFKRDGAGYWPTYVEDIINFKEKEVVGWILQYLKVKKNPIWNQLRFCDEEIDFLERKRAEALQAGNLYADAMKLIKERSDEREKLMKQFYGQHSDLRSATKDELFPVSPENIYLEMKIPESVYRIRQVKDVPKS